MRAACPAPECRSPLPLAAAHQLLPTKAYSRFHGLLLQGHVDASPHITWWVPANTMTLEEVAVSPWTFQILSCMVVKAGKTPAKESSTIAVGRCLNTYLCLCKLAACGFGIAGIACHVHW